MVVDSLGTAVPHENIGGDKITVGDIEGSYAAIGNGASVIVNQIQHALSAVDELEKTIQLAERKLAEAIQAKLKNIANVAATARDRRFNPYKALLDYELQDAPFFYGRTAAIQTVQEKMQQSQLTILYSESGSGKSSLLQAGLASRLLAEGHFPLYVRPYRQMPGECIKRAFLPDYDSQPELSRFADDQMSLNGFLARVAHYLGGRRLYIFVDQFEEFFTELPLSKQEAFAELLQACLHSDLPIWWVLALRKEYFSELRLFQMLKPFDNAYFLSTFKLEEAQEVITEPAKRKGVGYEDGLIEKVLADLDEGKEGIAPVQMQLVCYTLFEELAEENSKEISWSLYQKPRGQGVTGAEGILTSHLSRVLNRQMSGRQRQIASRALEALTNSQKMRVKKRKRDLVLELGHDASQTLEDALDILYNNHLIRLEKDEHDESIYELTHDYLLLEIDHDPETQGRKLAQEIIFQELHVSQENKQSRISADKLAMIEPYLINLNLEPEAEELVKVSQDEILQAQQAEEAMRKRQLYLAWSLVGILAIIVGIFLYPIGKNYYFQRKAMAETELISLTDTSQNVWFEANEVSNLQYSYCEEVGVCSLPVDPTHGYLDPQRKSLPVVGVTAYQAYLYCDWLDRQLPTLEDWHFAFREVTPSVKSANLWLDPEDFPPELVSVYGKLDETNETNEQIVHLVGNAMEWTRSFAFTGDQEAVLWDGDVDAVCTDAAQTNCDGWVLQAVGGGILSDLEYFVPEEPFSADPFGSSSDRGFRCVASSS
ncbi:MAG: hypothetical protein DHS20C20_03710 [Ardenticatenaceae bacterium]|nr:MAG: hypothetical protein DHS20C20_03710 [Ardenticatenaceae bacterium]